jgi:integrase
MAHLVPKKRKNPDTGQIETYYRIGWLEDGRQRTEALGFLPKDEAKRHLKWWEAEREASAQKAEAGGQAPQPPGPGSRRSLKGYVVDRLIPWMEAEGRKPKTITSARTSSAHLDRLLGNVDLADLNRRHVERYIAIRRGEGAKARTIGIELGHLAQVLERAVEDRHRDEVFKVRKPGLNDSRSHVWLTAEQSEQLLAVLPWAQRRDACMAIYTALELGMRSGEILSRRWEDVRWEQTANGALWIGPRLNEDGRKTWEPKRGRCRTLPLTENLRAALLRHHVQAGSPTSGWIFASATNPGHPLRTFRGTLRLACKRAGVPKVHPHALRHTWATRMARGGTPMATTQVLGGWSSPSILIRIYQHATSELEGQALEGVSLSAPPIAATGVEARQALQLVVTPAQPAAPRPRAQPSTPRAPARRRSTP